MLALTDLTYRIAGRTLLDHATVRCRPAPMSGLVGRNGTGKTTLFRIIAGEITPEQGQVQISPRDRIGRLAQEAPNGPESLLDVVLQADAERTQLLAEAETEREPARIAEIQCRLVDIGAHSAPARAAEILAGLGFSHADQQRPVAEFSGGWRMRVALAATLFAEPISSCSTSRPTISTSKATLWLEEHIRALSAHVIVISHDRDLSTKRSTGFLISKRQAHALSRRLHRVRAPAARAPGARREARRQQEAERTRCRPSSTASGPRPPRRAGAVARQTAGQARAGRRDRRRRGAADRNSAARESAVAADHRARRCFRRLRAGQPVLRRLTLRIDDDDRIALLGANGNGKSTLVKLLAGRLEPMSGQVTGRSGSRSPISPSISSTNCTRRQRL
jgi:ATP-binding cassette subfamily F protein 3